MQGLSQFEAVSGIEVRISWPNTPEISPDNKRIRDIRDAQSMPRTDNERDMHSVSSGEDLWERMEHISVYNLERYHLGMVRDEAELASIEEHFLACSQCAELAEETAEDVDSLRGAIIIGNFDLLRW
jgi:hypothetical protein